MSLSLLHHQDEQCNHHHSGILCGGCKPNFSAVFGSTQCKQCNNQYLWVILLISIMGLAMVVLIFLLNCTVSAGTLNGLILYANIIKPGIIIFLHSHKSQNAFETFLVFIAWLNLNLGIETCFYDGMDMYAKTWLELLFPLYILALVGAIIIESRWSSMQTSMAQQAECSACFGNINFTFIYNVLPDCDFDLHIRTVGQ